VKVFWNAQERRLRVLWRLIGQLLVFVALMVLLTLLAGWALTLGSTGSAAAPVDLRAVSPQFVALSAIATLLATLGSLWVAGRLLDRRPFAGFGFHLRRAWWGDFAFGLALGALMMTAIFLVELAVGWVTIRGTLQTARPGQPFAQAFAMPLVLFLCVGIYEEALSRGYLLRNLSEGLSFRFVGRRGAIILAWALSSLVFGALHLSNPNSSAVSTLNLAFAGLLLGLGYVLTGEMAIPIGLHITWNLFQGNVYGFPVSGGNFSDATFIAITQHGPDWVTGGVFGPEAGLIGFAAMAASMVLVALWVRRRRGHLAFDASLAQPPG
jgi:hypothetical protein